MSAQLAQALQFIVSVVMVKQGDGAINTQNKLYSIEAVSGDEARGKAIPLAQADFPEHQFHTACFWALEAAPQQEPDKLDAERLDFIENEALELTTRETGEDDFVWEVAQFYMAMPHRRVLGTAGGLRAAIDEARKAQP